MDKDESGCDRVAEALETTTMATITVEDIESVRFSAPDLPRMQAFLTDFGMTPAEDGGDGALRMRGTGNAPFVHETVPGDPGFVALVLRAASRADLDALAAAEGTTVEAAPGPGGGSRVVLTDPDGFRVEVVAGKARTDSLGHGVRALWNTMLGKHRPSEPKRVAAGAANVVRLGHVVLGVTDTEATWAWYRDRFGLIMSDEVRAPNGALAAAFIRCDRGDDPADHHTLNFASIPGKPAAFHHAAFEVADLDDLMAGHEHLKVAGHTSVWGVGRHILGSQVFDYWQDPWGHKIEHWTDGDAFTADVPTGVVDVPTMLGHQWGPPAPVDFA